MKILRHILSHLFLIFFLVAIVSVFYYRTLLLPNDVVEKVDGIVTEIYPPALKFVSKRDYFWSIAGERIVSFDDLTIFKKDSEVAITTAEPDTKIIDADKEVETDIQIKKEETVVAKVDETVATKKIIVEPETVKPTIAEPEATKEPIAKLIKGNNQENNLPAIVKDSDTSSERDLLISARNAFNQGEMIESEKLYIELTKLDNDDPNNFGELGNVYYSQGKWDEAGQAYYEAAVRLITERNYNQVAYLQRVISGLNTEHAEKLAQLMMRR